MIPVGFEEVVDGQRLGKGTRHIDLHVRLSPFEALKDKSLLNTKSNSRSEMYWLSASHMSQFVLTTRSFPLRDDEWVRSVGPGRPIAVSNFVFIVDDKKRYLVWIAVSGVLGTICSCFPPCTGAAPPSLARSLLFVESLNLYCHAFRSASHAPCTPSSSRPPNTSL